MEGQTFQTLLLIIVALAQALMFITRYFTKSGTSGSGKSNSSSPSNGNGNNGRKPYHYVIPGSGDKCIQHEGRIIKLEEQNQRGREDYKEIKEEMNKGFEAVNDNFKTVYQKLDALK